MWALQERGWPAFICTSRRERRLDYLAQTMVKGCDQHVAWKAQSKALDLNRRHEPVPQTANPAAHAAPTVDRTLYDFRSEPEGKTPGAHSIEPN